MLHTGDTLAVLKPGGGPTGLRPVLLELEGLSFDWPAADGGGPTGLPLLVLVLEGLSFDWPTE